MTYQGVLTSFGHEGLLEEAWTYLNYIFDLHGVVRIFQIYNIMPVLLTLLSNLGLLEDAKRITDQMPIERDAHTWQILLSAFSIHGNIDLERLAAGKLLELQPENESASVLL